MRPAADETATRSSRGRTFGYAVRGSRPIGCSGLLPAGTRVSALTSFDTNGFVAWEFTEGTYNASSFTAAAESVVARCRPSPPPAPRAPCV